jgi:traI
MKIKHFVLLACCLVSAGSLSAQWVVSDPSNLAQGIINSSKNIVHTSSTAENMARSFEQTVKIYEQSKEYYDALRKVKNLIRNARKVQQTILMVGDITDIYVSSFRRMLSDPYFTANELSAIAAGYTVLLEESAAALQDLHTVVNENGISMNDSERMQIIDKCYDKVYEYRSLVQYYTNKNIGVSLLRARRRNDQDRILSLYGNSAERYW